ncbi:MAG: fatty acid--CoA ligase family protein [Streptosporangiaceae bacterium]|jgi:acyl-CoA synthetase (AMP-forming)/AMP-acid ligase II
MSITTILEMAASAGDGPAITADGRSVSAAELLDLALAAAARFREHRAVVYLGTSGVPYPVALFGAAFAGVPFIPLNYRLSEQQIAALLARHPGAYVVRDEVPSGAASEASPADPDDVAVILYTSGTTAEPKAALLRHRHLLAYVLNTVEFASAEPGDATLVSVPPYHVAGLVNLLTSLYAGRRIVYMPAFDPRDWLATVRAERVTHAMVVPTMLARIVDAADEGAPSLRNISYGGARMPTAVLVKALKIFPTAGFVNAYGLTETASSIAVLTPEDHRAALASDDEQVRARLGSVGRPLPGIEFSIHNDAGESLGPGETGLVYVRGDQISGEYGAGTALDAGGWFATRDLGRLDGDGYLFIQGRADDTIIRGGENIAPAEIEDVLVSHPGITEAAVVGVPDPEWGQRLAAVVVGSGDPEEIKSWVRDRLRSSKTPDLIVFRDELPRTETGKLLRRVLLTELEATHA